MKILIIEDEPELLELTKKALEKERYIVEVAANYRQAMEKVGVYDYECILLDLMLPDGDGLTLLNELKKMRKRDSVIIVSARGSVEDKIQGLELGADDYLAKPFHLSELIARIKSVIRRKHNDGETTISLGNVEIFPESFGVQVAGEPLELNRKEYDILLYFANRCDRLINKSAMAEAIWGDHIDQVDNFDFIYAQIKNLRKKLKEAEASIEIKSVYGIGYKMTVL
ncbi:MAG: response regulator transcription factor [Porphyromonadaceae bacterium]|nr:response regulator transcription factor [Porphyromonadaceae bacterium]